MLNAVKKTLNKHLPLSLGEQVGCGAFIIALLLAFVDFHMAVIPLAGFVLLCLIAPFLSGISFFLPIVSRGTSGQNAVALTFDDGPDPLTTPEFLKLLKKHRATGTFFVNGRKAIRHPHLIKEIVSQGHCLGNHSFRHDMLLVLKSSPVILREIETAQKVIERTGYTTLAFRPPAGITSPRLRPILQKKGMITVNFSCRAWDGGNRWIRNLSKRIVQRVKPDDIVLLHDLAPRPISRLPFLINEIDLLLKGIQEKGLVVLPLAELIGRPVMRETKNKGNQSD